VCVCVYSFFPRRDIKKENKKESLVLSLFFSSFCFFVPLSSKEIFALLFLLCFFCFFCLGKKKKIEGRISLLRKRRNTNHQKKTQERFNNNKMGFLGLGRKKKSEAELAEEERVKRANMPWYARMFGMDSCCGNRKELKKSKDNNNNTNNNGASSMD